MQGDAGPPSAPQPPTRTPKLLTGKDGNPKQRRDPSDHYQMRSLFLAHADTVGAGVNVCPGATEECILLCLDNSGKGDREVVEASRKARVEYYARDRAGYLAQLRLEVGQAVESARGEGKTLALRLNATSDLDYEVLDPALFDVEDALLYDYTRVPKRLRGPLPSNYVVALSFTGRNWEACERYMRQRGGRVSVVFRGKPGRPLPECWRGFEVVDGDEHDRIWERPSGVILGLRAKGLARPEGVRAEFIVEDW